MSSRKPKSTDALMKYLRDEKGISISGSLQKQKLMNMGYYHGYKGYRYIKNPANQIPYSKFEELVAIYDFDAQIKSLFYPCVMTIETALKNYVLEEIVKETKSDNFITVYSQLLDNYKMFSTTGRVFPTVNARKQAEDKFKNELKKRLDLRNRIYRIQSDAYGNGNRIADHYLKQYLNLPIWGIFELLSLGEFGHFVSCLNRNCRASISGKLGINPSDDSNAMMPQRLIYATKDLRNAIAHNDVVFDVRFRSQNIDKQVSNAISNATGVQNITFDTITDYLILVIYQMRLIGTTKTELKRIISDYEKIVDKLYCAIPANVFGKIIYTNNRAKIRDLLLFVTK